jgi:RNA polymerase primary sigma factor
MSVAELQEFEEVKSLLARGQQVGVLTYAEIAGVVSELDLDEGDVEELHGFFERVEIELVEEIDPALAAAEVERAPAKRTRRKARQAGRTAARRSATPLAPTGRAARGRTAAPTHGRRA